MRFSASPRPTVVVVLPSPAGVGLIAVTRISLPSGRRLGVARQSSEILRLVVAVGLERVVGDAEPRGDLRDGQQLRLLGDLDVGPHGSPLPKRQREVVGDGREALVPSPESGRSGQYHRSQQVNVDVADPSPHEPTAIDEIQRLHLRGDRRMRQVAHQRKHLCTTSQVAT